jgi:tetratricopeptide (TPR) repeat protein
MAVQRVKRFFRCKLTYAVALLPLIATNAECADAYAIITRSLAQGQFELALQNADAEIRRQPRDPRLWTLRALALGHLNRAESSLESFREALRLQPNYLPALQGAAEIEYRRKDPGARVTLESIVASVPKNQVAHAMLAVLAFEAADCSAAVSHFEQAPEQTAGQKAASWQYAVCLFRLGRMPQAANAFRTVLGHNERDKNARINLAIALAGAGRSEEVIPVLLPLADDPAPDADVLGMLGESYRAIGQLPEAIAAFRRGIALYPREERLYMGVAALCIHYDSLELGLEILNIGLRNVPDSSRLYAMRGFLHSSAARTEEALADFGRASEIAPSDAAGQTGRALTLLHSGRADESIRVLREEVARDGSALNSRYVLAQALLRKGGEAEEREAHQHLGECTRVDPSFAPARALLGKLHLQRGERDAAIRELEAALSAAPDNRVAVYQLIRAYNAAGRNEDGRRMNEKIRDLLEKERQAEAETRRFRLLKMPE